MSIVLNPNDLLLELQNSTYKPLAKNDESLAINNKHTDESNALLLDIESADIEDLSDSDDIIITNNTILNDNDKCTILCSETKTTDEIETNQTNNRQNNIQDNKYNHLPPLSEDTVTETITNEVVYLRATSKSSEDRIGDLGNLSDFTDHEDNTSDMSQSHPLRAKDIDYFVDIDDKTGSGYNTHRLTKSNSNLIDITNHIDINIQQSIYNILCNNNNSSVSDYTDNDNENKMDSNDTGNDTITPAVSPDIGMEMCDNKYISTLEPNVFDICLLTSSPLVVKGNNIQNEDSLEYLHHALPNRIEIHNCIYDKLNDINYNIRYGHFLMCKEWIQKIMHGFGGCKILQMVGLCCNPVRDSKLYPEICELCEYNDDNDYMLLQLNQCGESKWYAVNELINIFNNQSNNIDMVICISPQHKRMCNIFKTFGFNYIIGVQSPENYYSFAKTETNVFLKHLYYGLLNKGSISHSFHLSVQAAISLRNNSNQNIDEKYMLYINPKYKLHKYIIFDHIKYGKVINLTNKYSSNDIFYMNNNYHHTNLMKTQRPFVGRSMYVIKLSNKLKLTSNKIINVYGRELIGKSTTSKHIIRYLFENGLFSGGCFVIDCKAKKYKNTKISFNQCVYNTLHSCNINDLDVLSNTNKPFCFIILNMNEWHTNDGKITICRWIEHYAHLLFKHKNSKIICTNNKPLYIDSYNSNLQVTNMNELTDLNRNELAMIFKYFIGDIHNLNFNIRDIENHDGLQHIFNGSPGITQKVAQFVMMNMSDNNSKISLDQIEIEYNNKHKPKPMCLKLCSISAPLDNQSNLINFGKSNVLHLQLDRSVSLRRPREEKEESPDPESLIADPYLPPSPSNQKVTYRSMPKSHSLEKIMAISKEEPIQKKSDKINKKKRHINQSMELQIHNNNIIHFSDINDIEFIGKQIWNISCSNNYQTIVTLNDLYPNLIKIFKRLTDDSNNIRQPKLFEIKPFFIKNGGEYDSNCVSEDVYIKKDKFHRFFLWFHCMCNIINDLYIIYNNIKVNEYYNNSQCQSLFYSRDTAKQKIKKQYDGTFVIRLASQSNGLAITFKKVNGRIANIILKRVSNKIYTVGKTQKKTDLFQLISSFSKLKYLYICDEYQISKQLIFNNINSIQRMTPISPSLNMSNISDEITPIPSTPSLSMKQSFTEQTYDNIYAEIDTKDNSVSKSHIIPEIEEFVTNFSTFYAKKHESINNRNQILEKENNELKLKYKQLHEEHMELKKEAEKVKQERDKLKHLFMLRYHCNNYSVNTPTSISSQLSNTTPTSIGSFSASADSSPVTPFDIIDHTNNNNNNFKKSHQKNILLYYKNQ